MRSGSAVGDRIVRSDPPTRRDFLAPASLGRHFADPRRRRLADGVSVFANEEQARRLARRYQLGGHIAEVELPEGCEIRRTQRGTAGHHTVWADPDRLLNNVRRVVAVE